MHLPFILSSLFCCLSFMSCKKWLICSIYLVIQVSWSTASCLRGGEPMRGIKYTYLLFCCCFYVVYRFGHTENDLLIQFVWLLMCLEGGRVGLKESQ